MSLLRKLGTAGKLSWHARVLFLQAWFLLLGVDWGLRLLPFPRVQGWAAGGKRRAAYSHDGDPAPLIYQVSEQVSRAARNHLYPMSCLRRSLVLQRILRGQGVVAELRIGVRKEGEKLEAHAWVEVEEAPVGETEEIAVTYPPLGEVERVVKEYGRTF